MAGSLTFGNPWQVKHQGTVIREQEPYCANIQWLQRTLQQGGPNDCSGAENLAYRHYFTECAEYPQKPSIAWMSMAKAKQPQPVSSLTMSPLHHDIPLKTTCAGPNQDHNAKSGAHGGILPSPEYTIPSGIQTRGILGQMSMAVIAMKPTQVSIEATFRETKSFFMVAASRKNTFLVCCYLGYRSHLTTLCNII
ncbi:hypothetical protein BJV82DRAFT_669824 [Fennellomyces sp. T-0311]|nr:hypothetical protein BJV82DRAFT_669824 [Fennellomyces sp. T-0311]